MDFFSQIQYHITILYKKVNHGQFVNVSHIKVKFHFRWNHDCWRIGRKLERCSKIFYIHPRSLESFYTEHLPIQSFPFTVSKILSHFFLLGKLFGQIQPKMGDWRRVCHELWHAGLKQETKSAKDQGFGYFVSVQTATYTSVITHWSCLTGQLRVKESIFLLQILSLEQTSWAWSQVGSASTG